MPELPEIEIVKRSLFKMINKAKIIDMKIYNKNLRYKIPRHLRKYLVNEKICKISRRSKYLIFYFRNKMLLAHLGMTGKFFLLRSKDNKIMKTSFYYNLNILPKHNHIDFTLDNGIKLIYNDIRKFGFFKFFNHKKLNEIGFIKKLGLEPFSSLFNLNYFKNFIKNKKKKHQKFTNGSNFYKWFRKYLCKRSFVYV
tara:strand:+ start:202 stop:789 length:588 start_codon:yes stop_codon:yes gene_type:complete